MFAANVTTRWETLDNFKLYYRSNLFNSQLRKVIWFLFIDTKKLKVCSALYFADVFIFNKDIFVINTDIQIAFHSIILHMILLIFIDGYSPKWHQTF